jgi:hypothetical protein
MTDATEIRMAIHTMTLKKPLRNVASFYSAGGSSFRKPSPKSIKLLWSSIAGITNFVQFRVDCAGSAPEKENGSAVGTSNIQRFLQTNSTPRLTTERAKNRAELRTWDAALNKTLSKRFMSPFSLHHLQRKPVSPLRNGRAGHVFVTGSLPIPPFHSRDALS